MKRRFFKRRFITIFYRYELLFQVVGQQFGDVINLDLQSLLFSAATQLHDAARAVHHQAIRPGGLHVVDFLFQKLCRYFGELYRVAAAESSAYLFFLAGHILGGIGNKRSRGFLHVQATAKVAGSVVGDLLPGLLEVFGLEPQHVMHK